MNNSRPHIALVPHVRKFQFTVPSLIDDLLRVKSPTAQAMNGSVFRDEKNLKLTFSCGLDEGKDWWTVKTAFEWTSKLINGLFEAINRFKTLVMGNF